MGEPVHRFCVVCQRETRHEKGELSNRTGFFLSTISLGAFLPLWLLYGVLIRPLRPWRCQPCAAKRDGRR